MSPFVIVICTKCRGILAAKEGCKTSKCPYCGFRLLLNRARKVTTAQTAEEASRILRKLKQDAHEGKSG